MNCMVAVFDLTVFTVISKCLGMFFPNVSSKCFPVLFSSEVGDLACLEL